jgi:hypothetical protein
METKVIISLFCLLFSFNGIAQSKVLRGKVTNENYVEGIHILNTTSRFNAITNENGNFSIRVKKEDTLVFSSVSYVPEKLIVSEEVYEKAVLTIRLAELVNELDEVILGPNLSGNIATDVQNIKTEKKLNFDDVGIPGFKGEPEEKIVPVAMAFFPTNVNLEAIYKYASGYYKKLKLKRKWETENTVVASIINQYSLGFFNEAFQIPKNRVYDFILFCLETSTLQNDFDAGNFSGVLKIFETKGKEFVKRLLITAE